MHETSLAEKLQGCWAAVADLLPTRIQGTLTGVSGLLVEIAGLAGVTSVGDRIGLSARDNRVVLAEIVGFRGGLAQALPFGAADGLGPGGRAVVLGDGGPWPSPTPGSAAWSIRSVLRSTTVDGWRSARSGAWFAPLLHRQPRAPGSGHGSTSASGQSTCSPPADKVSASACSPDPASASRPCLACWPARRSVTWPFSPGRRARTRGPRIP